MAGKSYIERIIHSVDENGQEYTGAVSRLYRENQKIRGIRRKFMAKTKRFSQQVKEFPKPERGWHVHLPGHNLMDRPKTPHSLRRKCIQYLIDSAHHLALIKPENIWAKVVVYIELPDLQMPAVHVYFDKGDHQKCDVDRDDGFFVRTSLPPNRNIVKEWHLDIPDFFQVKGFSYCMHVADTLDETGECWLIGELDRDFI